MNILYKPSMYKLPKFLKIIFIFFGEYLVSIDKICFNIFIVKKK